MADDPNQDESGTAAEVGAEALTDEIVQKYAPERLLGMVAKKAGRGESLDASLRAKYEKRLGVDLGHVRIFSGEFAAEFNKKREAHAVTVGNTGMVLMGSSPDMHRGSAQGEALLAHELTHVAQAKGGRADASGISRHATWAGEFTAAHELEAHQFQDLTEAELLGLLDKPGKTKQAKAEDREAAIERIKERVLEMAADAQRNLGIRSGSNRRA